MGGITAPPVPTHSRTPVPTHPALAHCVPSSLGFFSLGDQKARRVHAGTRSPCDSPAAFPLPIGFLRRPAPKLRQSPRRSRPSKRGARTLLCNHCRATVGRWLVGGGALRGVPTVPPQVIVIPGRGLRPGPKPRTRVAHLPQLLASRQGFSVSPAFAE